MVTKWNAIRLCQGISTEWYSGENFHAPDYAFDDLKHGIWKTEMKLHLFIWQKLTLNAGIASGEIRGQILATWLNFKQLVVWEFDETRLLSRAASMEAGQDIGLASDWVVRHVTHIHLHSAKGCWLHDNHTSSWAVGCEVLPLAVCLDLWKGGIRSHVGNTLNIVYSDRL